MGTLVRHEITGVCSTNIRIIACWIKGGGAFDTRSINTYTFTAVRIFFTTIRIACVWSIATCVVDTLVDIAGVPVFTICVQVAAVWIWNIKDTGVVVDVAGSHSTIETIIAVSVFCTATE